MAVPRCAMGLSEVCDCGISDHTHYFWQENPNNVYICVGLTYNLFDSLSAAEKEEIRNISEKKGTTFPLIIVPSPRESSGSVVECLTRDRRAVGSSLTGVTVLWSLSKTHLS